LNAEDAEDLDNIYLNAKDAEKKEQHVINTNDVQTRHDSARLRASSAFSACKVF